MTKIIKKVTLNAPASTSTPSTPSASSGQTGVDPTKGTQTNPYTQEEFYSLLDLGIWSGGWVEGMGYAIPQTTITSDYLIDSEWLLWDSWASWEYGDSSTYYNTVIVPFMGVGTGGGGGTTGNTSNSNNHLPMKLYITNGYTPSSSELSELLSCISALPNQLKYLLNYIPFTFICANPDQQDSCAYYKVDKRMVYLYSNNSITQATILHEMFHAWQHDQGYIVSGETNENSYYNLEFETYVTLDVLQQKNYGILNSWTAGEANRYEYQDFIQQCYNDGTFNFSVFISHIYDFYYGFIDSHRKSKDMDPKNGAIPTAAELDNPNYIWHWSTYFRFWGIME